MNAALVINGRDVVESHPNDSRATDFEASTGVGRMVVRPPQAMRGLFDRLATNEPIVLSDTERAQVEGLGIRLADATDVVRKRDAFAALAAGSTADAINARPPTPQHFKPMQPIKITRSFIPGQRTY